MMRINIGEILGEQWTDNLLEFREIRNLLFEVPTVGVDGRMLPHEWLETSSGLIKTDGEDHHGDDFFPGYQDVAWDLAAAIVEFNLSEEEQEYLISRYHALQPDPTLAQRLSFYTLAYLCFRAGYTKLAAQTLVSTPDGLKFKSHHEKYASVLRQELSRPSLLRGVACEG